jgi:hypothetical protein
MKKPTIIVSGITGKIISGMEHVDRVAKTGISEDVLVVFGGDCEKAYEADVLLNQAQAVKLQTECVWPSRN